MSFSNEINWCNYGQYKIIDVPDREHFRIQQYMLEHFRCHGILKLLKMQQEPGIEDDFLKIVKHILGNESSIIVVDNELNELKGAALLMCMTKEWRSWTCLQLLIENERFKELFGLISWCLQQETVRIKNNPGGDSLHIFAFCFCKELEEDKEFLAHFFNVICEVARHMHMPRVTAVCLSQRDQERMRSVGFVEMVRIVYSLFMFNNRRPFDRLRDINEMYGVFFEKKVQPLVPYQEMLVRNVEAAPIEDFSKKPKVPKKDGKLDDDQEEMENS